MMALEYSTRASTYALVTRCIPYRFEPTKEELIEIACGKQIYIPENINIKYDYSDKHSIIINNNEYMEIINFIQNEKIDKNIFMRTLGDCCRTFAVLKYHDFELYRLICKLKQQAHQRHKLMEIEEIKIREKISAQLDKS